MSPAPADPMRRLIRLGAVLALLSTPLPAVPVEQGGKSLREAVERSEIVPLQSLVRWIEEHYYGQVVEVELENEAGEFGYEIDLLTPAGAKIEFQFDARSGELLSISGKDIDQARRP